MEKIHVLLVEDEQTLAMIIKDTLEEQDFIITTVSIRPRACFSPSYNKVKSQTRHVWLLTLL